MTTLQAQALESVAARVAALFRSRPGSWIDGRDIAKVGGCYGWRTRVSNARKFPFNLTIDNRQRRISQPDGSSYVVSEYRYVPAAVPEQLPLAGMAADALGENIGGP